MKNLLITLSVLFSFQALAQMRVAYESEVLTAALEDFKNIDKACNALTSQAVSKIKAFQNEVGELDNIQISNCYVSMGKEEKELINVDVSFEYTVTRKSQITDKFD